MAALDKEAVLFDMGWHRVRVQLELGAPGDVLQGPTAWVTDDEYFWLTG